MRASLDNGGKMTDFTIVNILIIIFMPLLYIGIINKTKAVWAGRKGASVVQPFYDFIKLLKKGEVISSTTTAVFKVSPSIQLASVICAALVVPMSGHDSFVVFTGDFIVFAYILALGKFFSIISAMDTGSSFEGMGASREATYSTLVEPGFFILIGSLALMSSRLSFSEIFSAIERGSGWGQLVVVAGVITLFIMLLVEGCRVPVDDPNTHLELTMIHEVIVLDNSGPDLAFITYAAALKMVLFSALGAGLILPHELPVISASVLFILLLIAAAVLVGTIESLMARFRMSHLPQFIFLITSVALIVFCTILLFTGGRMG